MQKRKLGRLGLEVSALGLGCMGMSWAYGEANDQESLEVLKKSLSLGINFWDTAEIYGPFKNEELLGRALRTLPRDEVVVASKFGWEFSPSGERGRLNSKPSHVRKALEGTLKRLGTSHVDLYYQHRLDPEVPIEETMGVLADFVREGKVRFIGLSEVGSGTIRRAHAVHPLSAVQSEYSLWERGVEVSVLPTLRELGIGFVAYSPMGRGFLTGKIQSKEDLTDKDGRRNHPRFQGENLTHNLRLVEAIRKIAETKNATPAQIALAWLLNQGSAHAHDIVPIPGTKRLQYLCENAASCDLVLSSGELQKIKDLLSGFETAGTRYPKDALAQIDTTDKI